MHLVQSCGGMLASRQDSLLLIADNTRVVRKNARLDEEALDAEAAADDRANRGGNEDADWVPASMDEEEVGEEVEEVEEEVGEEVEEVGEEVEEVVEEEEEEDMSRPVQRRSKRIHQQRKVGVRPVPKGKVKGTETDEQVEEECEVVIVGTKQGKKKRKCVESSDGSDNEEMIDPKRRQPKKFLRKSSEDESDEDED